MIFEDHCFCHRFFKFSAQPLLSPYRAIVGIWLGMSISLKFLQSNRAAMEPPCWALYFRRAPTDLFIGSLVPSSSIGNEFKVPLITCGSWWKISLLELARVGVLLSLSQAVPSGFVFVRVLLSLTLTRKSVQLLFATSLEWNP